ncbi:MAG TPA: glycine cleavage system protein GcvH [Candidatus Acidoferrales bacterium]|nr:glycine cleavage system protein GcvH [Candidatus Acidoferrales bacterium]
MYPADFRYTKDHEWIQVSGTTGTIGITDYAQHALGDVVFVELPKTGIKVKAGDVLGTVESVKAVSEVFSPAAGEVIEVNSSLANAPEKINQEPHSGAWLVKLRLDSPKDAANLMDAKAYTAYVAEKEKEQTA